MNAVSEAEVGLCISFFVPGIPRPGGSKTAKVVRRKGGEIVMVNGRPLTTTREAGKHTAAWRSLVADFAQKAYQGEPFAGPLRLDLIFVMPRPKNHYRANGGLKSTAPSYHTSLPDRTKLMRSTEDALTGILWRNDAQICAGSITKIYGEKPGARITVQLALETL